jgi:hypothetical protein
LKNKGLIPINAPEVDDDAVPDDDETAYAPTPKPLTHNPMTAALREVVPASLIAGFPVTSHVGASGGVRNEAPSATVPPASAVARRVAVVDGWTVRELPGGDGCTITPPSGIVGGGDRTPVLVDDTVFLSASDAARFLGTSGGNIHKAMATGGTLRGYPIRRAKFDAVVEAMPRLIDEVLERATKPAALPAPVDIPPPEVKSKEPEPEPKKEEPMAKEEVAPFTLVPAAVAKEERTLADEIAEAMTAAAKWPRLRRYILAALLKAEEDMSKTEK